MFVACLCLYPGIYWRIWGKKSFSGVSKNHKTNYNTPVHIWDPRWLTMCVGIRILRHYYLLLYLRVYWGWSVCCFLGLLFFDWGPGYVRRGFIVDRPPPTPSTGNWKAREKTTTDITRSPIKEQRPQETAHTSPQYTRRYNST